MSQSRPANSDGIEQAFGDLVGALQGTKKPSAERARKTVAEAARKALADPGLAPLARFLGSIGPDLRTGTASEIVGLAVTGQFSVDVARAVHAWLSKGAFTGPWIHPVGDTADPLIGRLVGSEDEIVAAVAVDPQGRTALVGGSGSLVAVWDLGTCARLRTVDARLGDVTALALHPEGKIAFAGAEEGLARLDLEGGKRTVMKGHSGAVRALALLPSGERLVSGGDDGALRLWDTATGACLKTLAGHTDAVIHVRTSRDGSHAVSTSRDATLRLWDLASGACLATTALKGFASAGHADFHPISGHVLAMFRTVAARPAKGGSSVSYEDTMLEWDGLKGGLLRGAEALKGKRDRTLCQPFVITPDARLALGGPGEVGLGSGEAIEGWTLEGTPVFHYETGLPPVRALALDAEGRTAVVGGDAGHVLVLDVAALALSQPTPPPRDVTTVALDATGARAISGSTRAASTGGWTLWDVATKTRLLRFDDTKGRIAEVHLQRDGRAAIALRGAEIDLWDLEAKSRVATLSGHPGEVVGIALDPGGQRMISMSIAGSTPTIKVWDLATRTAVRTLTDATLRGPMALLPDGRHLLAVHEGALKRWDLETGVCVATLTGGGLAKPGKRRPDDERDLAVLEVSGDGRHAATLDGKEQIVVWDLAGGGPIKGGWTNGKVVLLLSGPSRLVVSTGTELEVWSLDTGKSVRSFSLADDDQRLRSLAALPGGRWVVTGCSDGSVILWDLVEGQRAAHAVGENEVGACAASAGGIIAAGDDAGAVVFLAAENLDGSPERAASAPAPAEKKQPKKGR